MLEGLLDLLSFEMHSLLPTHSLETTCNLPFAVRIVEQTLLFAKAQGSSCEKDREHQTPEHRCTGTRLAPAGTVALKVSLHAPGWRGPMGLKAKGGRALATGTEVIQHPVDHRQGTGTCPWKKLPHVLRLLNTYVRWFLGCRVLDCVVCPPHGWSANP